MRLWMLAAITTGALLSGCSPKTHEIANCKAAENVICGITHPEDMEIVPGTRWLLSTGEHDKVRMVLFDPVTRDIKPLLTTPPVPTEAETFPRCGAPPEAIGTGAFHLSAAEDGTLRLLVLNRTRVERYRLTVSGDDIAVAWEGCVKMPDELAPNDVASLGDNGFVVSHMYEKPRTNWTDFKLFFGQSTGGAYRWTRNGGWARIPNSDAAFANGIQVDAKTGRIYIASMYNSRIIAINADGSDRQESPPVPQQNDNLSWSSDGKLIGVGHTGLKLFGTKLCRTLNGPPCTFPFAVIEMDPKTLAFKVLFDHQTETIPGASVAIVKDGTIYLGSTWGDRITIVKPQK